jgi:hypothetical protein
MLFYLALSLPFTEKRIGDEKRGNREKPIPRRWRSERPVVHEAHRHFNCEIEHQRDERGDISLVES